MRNAPRRDAAGRPCLRTSGKRKTCCQGRRVFSNRIKCSLGLTLGAGAVRGILQVLPASAIEFDDGELWGSLDTIASSGLHRVASCRTAAVPIGEHQNPRDVDFRTLLLITVSESENLDS